eukprot:2321872-Rhodomonas_salina.1
MNKYVCACHGSGTNSAICLRTCYAMPGTDSALVLPEYDKQGTVLRGPAPRSLVQTPRLRRKKPNPMSDMCTKAGVRSRGSRVTHGSGLTYGIVVYTLRDATAYAETWARAAGFGESNGRRRGVTALQSCCGLGHVVSDTLRNQIPKATVPVQFVPGKPARAAQ